MVSTGSAILAADMPDATWRALSVPPGAAPTRQIVVGTRANQAYLAGWSGLYRTDDWGESWQPVGHDIPGQVITRLLVIPDANAGAPRLLAVAGGAIWTSDDEGVTWRQRAEGLPTLGVDTVVADRTVPGRLWAGGADRLFRSDNGGTHWQTFGQPLGEQQTPIHGIAAAPGGGPLLLTTDRGLYRSTDSGSTWELLADSVPVHLPARPLVSDPHDPATVYAGFSIRPYDALWQNAADGSSAFQRLDAVNLGGALAFLVLLALAGGFVMQRLRRYYGPGPSAIGQGPDTVGRQQFGAQPRPGVSSSVSASTTAPLPEVGR
jgi:hypothetical protein